MYFSYIYSISVSVISFSFDKSYCNISFSIFVIYSILHHLGFWLPSFSHRSLFTPSVFRLPPHPLYTACVTTSFSVFSFFQCSFFVFKFSISPYLPPVTHSSFTLPCYLTFPQPSHIYHIFSTPLLSGLLPSIRKFPFREQEKMNWHGCLYIAPWVVSLSYPCWGFWCWPSL